MRDCVFAARAQGIKVVERVAIPPEMIPRDAHVEIDAKARAARVMHALAHKKAYPPPPPHTHTHTRMHTRTHTHP